MSLPEENTANPLEANRQHLVALRRVLLDLHGAILQVERGAYEREHGRVGAHELLRLLTEHQFFGWFRPLSEMVVQIDELLDSGEPVTLRRSADLLREVRSLLNPVEEGEEFGTRYREILQQDPAVILSHAEVAKLLRG